MNQQALALAESLRGQLADLGPGVCSVNAEESLSWLFIRIGAATDEILNRVTDDLGLAQARTARKGRSLVARGGLQGGRRRCRGGWAAPQR